MGHYTRYVIIGSVKVIIELLYLTFSKGGYPSLVFDINKQAVLIIWAVQTTPLREKGKENRAVTISRHLASNKVNVVHK